MKTISDIRPDLIGAAIRRSSGSSALLSVACRLSSGTICPLSCKLILEPHSFPKPEPLLIHMRPEQFYGVSVTHIARELSLIANACKCGSIQVRQSELFTCTIDVRINRRWPLASSQISSISKSRCIVYNFPISSRPVRSTSWIFRMTFVQE